MRKVKNILLLLALFAALALPIQVNAQEMGTGDTASTCNVTFVITDEANYPGTSIVLTMTDVTGVINDSYTLWAAGSWLNGISPTYTMTAPTTYNVAAEMEEGYTLVNTADHSTDLRFAATSQGEATVEWSIVSAASIAEKKEDGTSETANTGTYTIQAEDINNEDALEVFTSLITAIVNYQEYDREGWDYLMKKFYAGYVKGSDTILDYAEIYTQCTGGASEEWLNMDTLDQFLWLNTYLVVQRHLENGNLSNLTYSESNYKLYTMSQVDVFDEYLRLYGPMEGETYESLQAHIDELTGAIENLLWWQYSCLNSRGFVYSFMEDETCLQVYERMLSGEEVVIVTQNEEITNESEDNIEEETEETETVIKTTDEKESIWTSTINAVMSNIIPILIACVMGVILFFLVKRREKQNISNNSSGSLNAENTLDK